MRYSFLLFSSLLLLTGGCVFENANQQQGAVKHDPSAFINEKAVWKGNLDNCFHANPDTDCLINTIKEKGSSAAIKAAQYLAEKGEAGFITDFKQEGPVGIATVEYPFRANTNSALLFIPSTGKAIDSEEILTELPADSVWQAFEKRHPGAVPWPPATLTKKEYMDDGIALIFSYPVRTCHACENTAFIFLSYKFSYNGKFINYRLSAIKSSD